MPEEQDQRTERDARQDVSQDAEKNVSQNAETSVGQSAESGTTNGTQQPAQTPIIESASGTTDPENSHSGGAAYVIFGLAVVLLVLLCLGISSCTSTLGTLVSTDFGGGRGHGGHDLFDDYYDEDPYEDVLVPEDDYLDDYLFDYHYDFGDDLGGADSWFSGRLCAPGADAAEGGRA